MNASPLLVRFGASGDYRMWPGEGWDDAPGEDNYSWANAHVAKLRVILDDAHHDRLIELDLIPFRNGGLAQELFLYLNGAFVAYWSMDTAGVKSARVEGAFFNVGENLFAFVAPRAVRPTDVGLGDDQRLLSFAYRSMRLSDW